MKLLIILAALLPSAVWAESNLCTTKEQMVLSTDEQGQQLVTKISETTCLDHNGAYKNFGYAPVCGKPARGRGFDHINTVSCALPDGSWKVFDVHPNVDKFAEAPKKDIFLMTFYDYGTRSSDDVLFGKLFGLFKRLNSAQETAHQTAIHTALTQAETGQKVTWKHGNASGFAVPVGTFPSSQGYCKIIQISVDAHNTQNVDSKMACYGNSDGQWRWVRDK
jgi:surface antigen